MSGKDQHPALRMDRFMRSTDTTQFHADLPCDGETFIRKHVTYGHRRPTVSFTSESRAAREFLGDKGGALDMTNLPPEWMDPRGDPRERTVTLEEPPKVSTEFVKLYENHAIMLPSERFREHLAMKDGERQMREDKAAAFEYNKRNRVLHGINGSGIVGIDSPMHPSTKLYEDQRSIVEQQEEHDAKFRAERLEHLTDKTKAVDTITFKNYGTPVVPYIRSADIPVARKRIDPVIHPARFMNTHERLFPEDVPLWDPARAETLRSHEARGRQFNLITGGESVINTARKSSASEEGPALTSRSNFT